MNELDILLRKTNAEGDKFKLAKIGAAKNNGFTLIFDGAKTASTKSYKYNIDANFTAGDRVIVAEVSGSYVILCRI